MSTLFDLLRDKDSLEATKEVEVAQSKLKGAPVVELKGVNAPEFEEVSIPVEVAQEEVSIPVEVAQEETQADLQESQFAKQVAEQKAITIPVHDDGLDDDDGDDDWPIEEEEEELPFYLQSFEELAFTTRTANSLKNAGYITFNDVKGMAYSELLELKGFGRNSLEEIKEYFAEELPNEDVNEWLLKRKPRFSKKSNAVVEVEDVIETPSDDSSVDVSNAVETEEVIEVVQEQEEVLETESEEDLRNAIPYLNTSNDTKIEEIRVFESQIDDLNTLYLKESENVKELTAIVLDLKSQLNTLQEENKYLKLEKTYSHEQVKVLESKTLVVGGSTVAHPNLNVRSFENIYGPLIADIVSQANVPSLAMIDYAKGWALLGASIRQAGWPAGVDVICVSKSYLSRPEMILELRLMADIVIEN